MSTGGDYEQAFTMRLEELEAALAGGRADGDRRGGGGDLDGELVMLRGDLPKTI